MSLSLLQTYHGRIIDINPNLDPLRSKYSAYRVLIIALLMFASFTVVLLVDAQWGIGVSPDSVEYLALARNIIEFNGYVGSDGKAMPSWPPLYPVSLGVFSSLFHLDVLAVVPYCHAFLLSMIILVLFRISRIYGWSIQKEMAAGCMVLLSVPLLYVATWVWSELFFSLLVALFIYYSSLYVKTDLKKYIVAMAIIAGLATLTRYIGGTLIFSGVIYLLAFNKIEVRTRISRILLFAIFSSLPLLLFLARNYYATGTLTGDRSEPVTMLFPQIFEVFSVLSRWFLPFNGSIRLVLLVFLLGMLFTVFKLRELKSLIKENQIIISLIFIVIYIVSTILLSTITVIDSIGHRLLAPLYIPILIVAVAFFSGLIGIQNQRGRKNVLLGVKLLLSLTLIGAFTQRMIFEVIPEFSSGYNYMSDRWKESSTIEFMKSHKLSESRIIYSNHPDALHFHSRLKSVKFTPAKSVHHPVSLEELEGTWPQTDNATLIWFDPTPRNFLYNLDELKKVSELEKIRTFQDGAVYTVRKRLISKEVDQGR